MKIAKTLLAACALALGAGVAYADEKDQKAFNDMDKNADGKLTRAEYLTVMAKKDVGTVKEKVTKAGREAKEEIQEAQRRAPKGDQPAAAGATTDSGKPK